eukprot:826069-Pyramimonas_sp.AAC.1
MLHCQHGYLIDRLGTTSTNIHVDERGPFLRVGRGRSGRARTATETDADVTGPALGIHQQAAKIRCAAAQSKPNRSR